MLSDDELLRYSRQIFLPQIDIVGQQKLKKSKVLIIGLGGLGSPVSLYLTAAGIGSIGLMDFDRVDISNLQRQIVYNASDINRLKIDASLNRLTAINPEVKFKLFNNILSYESLLPIVKSYDVVVDCTDSFKTRSIINRVCFEQKIPMVFGSAIQFNGQVSTFNPNISYSPCFMCIHNQKKIQDDLSCSNSGVIGPVVGVVGSMQVLEVIKLLTGIKDLLVGKLLLIDLLYTNFLKISIEKKKNCVVCGY